MRMAPSKLDCVELALPGEALRKPCATGGLCDPERCEVALIARYALRFVPESERALLREAVSVLRSGSAPPSS